MNRDATDLAGVRHKHYDTLGSTNAEALTLARAGERGPLWVSAGQQTAGRGRRGNEWVSPPGNLYATLLVTEPSPPSVAAQLSFVAGLALRDALTACHAALDPRLKWPNDVLIGGKKVAGILIEAENTPRFSVAVGIGVNCTSHPVQTIFPATDLKAENLDAPAEQVLLLLVRAMGLRIAQWQAGRGFASIRAEWLRYAAGLHDAIRVRLPERELTGQFDGIDETGHLLLKTASGCENIAAGEVFGIGP
ncbi:MAG: biotin--[acetyl-CoA-carboxylase] ligase [Pseudolabrys sp.]|nr:biotin--[acetyl-CoA-carboxylase] ligase [Pseudolabrys sp.]